MWAAVKVGSAGWCVKNDQLSHRIKGEVQVYGKREDAEAQAVALNLTAHVPNNPNVPGWMR